MYGSVLSEDESVSLISPVETLDAVKARHRLESRELVAKVTSLKKTATKGEKRKKKEVLQQCDDMEKELNERHTREIKVSNVKISFN